MDIRCGQCARFLGESDRPLRMVGLFEDPRDRRQLPEPRNTWRCGKCGWATVFRPIEAPATKPRAPDVIELKVS